MSSAFPTQSNRGSWQSWAVPVISGLIVLGLVLLVVIYLCEWVGRSVSGEEFNPYTFETRSFSYRQSLITTRQLKGIKRTKKQDSLSKFISAQPWFPTSTQDQWDLMEDSTVEGDSLDWRSRPLVRLLKNEDFTSFWLDWSANHPELSKYLWLTVIELARENQYESIPLIFDAVSEIEDPVIFRDKIEEIIKTAN
ncbi:MAG: hypothetical protein VYC80_09645 [Planctomycetota bacterium]|nr:hypothetical protein [Planctomycetota bacterium]